METFGALIFSAFLWMVFLVLAVVGLVVLLPAKKAQANGKFRLIGLLFLVLSTIPFVWMFDISVIHFGLSRAEEKKDALAAASPVFLIWGILILRRQEQTAGKVLSAAVIIASIMLFLWAT